jgi:NAD(P)-dependent dehydrogenase (short-subunit alcohol dehydrogenase family)
MVATVDVLLEGRTAWITGAAGGIGRAVMQRLAASGAAVAGLDIHIPGPTDDAFGDDKWIFTTVDVRDAASVDRAAKDLVERVGAPDILVNSAGISTSASIIGHDLALWNDVVGTNLTGSFNLIRQVLGGMCERGFGRIVNVSSGSGFRVAAAHAAYGASKAGVVALTKATAGEGAPHGVTANVVAPGFVDTPMTRALFPTDEEMKNTATNSPIANPMGRPLRAEELAHAIWFLSLPDSGAITGQTLHVNNGGLMI